MNKEELFNNLVSKNSDRITRICSYYNNNTDAQKDIYQEILINIWKSLDSFRGDSSHNTWIYRIAVNTALSYTGKAYRHMKMMITSDHIDLNNLIDDNELASKMKQEQQLNDLQNEINLLSVIDKAIISLMLEGLSMKEISGVIGITESNVKVKIHRIKDQLKHKLQNQ